MKLNLNEMKLNLDTYGKIAVLTDSFESDMNVIKEFELEYHDLDLLEVGTRYLTKIFGINVNLVQEQNYITIKYN